MTISWLWCLSRSTARDIAVSGTRRTPLTAESLLLAGVAVSATLACTALAGPPCPQSTITVDVVTDATPEQNSWEIRNQLTDELIAAEGPFDQPSTFLSFDVCVASPGCYVFTFFDSQGNGIGPGAGYEVFFNNVSAGFGFRNFGFESSVFDIGDDCPTGGVLLLRRQLPGRSSHQRLRERWRRVPGQCQSLQRCRVPPAPHRRLLRAGQVSGRPDSTGVRCHGWGLSGK